MMAMTEEARRGLFGKLVDVLGEAHAVTLIDQFPPAGHDLATKQHVDERLDALEQSVRAEMADLRTELRAEMADLRTDMADLRTDMAQLRTEVRTETAALRTEVADRLAKHTRVTVFATVSMNAATMGVVLTAVGLG